MDRWKIIKAKKDTSPKNRLKVKDRYLLIPRILNIRKLEYCMLYRSVLSCRDFFSTSCLGGCLFFTFQEFPLVPLIIYINWYRKVIITWSIVYTWYTMSPYYFNIQNWMDQWGKSSLSIFVLLNKDRSIKWDNQDLITK